MIILNVEYRYSKYHMFVFCCRWSRSTRTDRGGRDGRAGGGRFGMEAIVVHTPVLLGTFLLQVSMSKSVAYCSQWNLSLSSHSVNPVPNWTRSPEKGYGLASDTAAELKFVAWFFWVLIRLYVRTLPLVDIWSYKTTGFSSQIRTKLRNWANRQAGAGWYSRATLPSNDSKTRYIYLCFDVNKRQCNIEWAIVVQGASPVIVCRWKGLVFIGPALAAQQHFHFGKSSSARKIRSVSGQERTFVLAISMLFEVLEGVVGRGRVNLERIASSFLDSEYRDTSECRKARI